MDPFLSKLDTRIAKELRHASGMLCMYRERLRAYECDLAVAELRRDHELVARIEGDLAAFRREVVAIEADERSARTRLGLLYDGGGFPNPPSRDGSPSGRDGI